VDTQTSLVPVSQTLDPRVQERDNDDNLIRMWLATKQSEHTRRSYAHVVDSFRQHTDYKPLATTTLADLLDYMSAVSGSDATKALATNTLKSLFTFGTELGYFTVNVAKALKAPKQRSELAQRILSEADVIRMIDRTTSHRDHALLRLLYHSGLRVSEIVALKWAHVREVPNGEGAVLDVFGKGSKQRYVLISKSMLDELRTLDGQVGSDRYVFQSRKSKSGVFPMDASQVDRIVLEAARRAGIDGNVSPHWLRHSNASHALDNGCPIHIVQQSLGHASLVTTTRYAHVKPGNGSSQYIKI